VTSSKLTSNPCFSGVMAVEVTFQRRDSDSRLMVRALPTTGCLILRGGSRRSKAHLEISVVPVFIVVSWFVVVRATVSLDRLIVRYPLQMNSGAKVSGFQKKSECSISFCRCYANFSGFERGAG
jgi:hypothetical protein